MTQLLDFYSGKGTDCEGRPFEELVHYDDMTLEFTHDVIQWLFPLNEHSAYNCDAPILTPEDIKAFRENQGILQTNLFRAFVRFLHFIGLDYNINNGKVMFAENFEDRQGAIWANFNHNHLRITRVLKCLKLLGFEDMARDFFSILKEIYEWQKFKITPETFRYWTKAVND